MTKVKIKYYLPVNQFPDYQTRIYRNTPDIEWRNKVKQCFVLFIVFKNIAWGLHGGMPEPWLA